MVLLFRRTVVASLTPPYNYGPELVDQFLFALRLGWFPMIVASLAFTYGPAGIEVGNFLNLLGALDRPRGTVRDHRDARVRPAGVRDRGPRGVAGTAMDRRSRRPQDPRGARCPDGARRRPDQEPRRPALFLSLMLLTPLFTIYALLFGTLGGVLVTVSNGAQIGPFFSTFFAQATTL